jgi:hypothetical protein
MNKSNVQKHGETGTQIFALVAALILSAVLASGCSTPPVQGSVNTDNTPPVSYASYSNCVQVMTAYGLQNQCYATNTPTTTSYSQYAYNKAGFAAGVTEDNMQDSYKAYLATLDEGSIKELNAKWDAIVATVSQDAQVAQ